MAEQLKGIDMQILFKSRAKARAFVAKSTGRKVIDNGSFAKIRWGVKLNIR